MTNPLILLVPEERIELSRAQGPEDFESSASTSFTTPALEHLIRKTATIVNKITLIREIPTYICQEQRRYHLRELLLLSKSLGNRW